MGTILEAVERQQFYFLTGNVGQDMNRHSFVVDLGEVPVLQTEFEVADLNLIAINHFRHHVMDGPASAPGQVPALGLSVIQRRGRYGTGFNGGS